MQILIQLHFCKAWNSAFQISSQVMPRLQVPEPYTLQQSFKEYNFLHLGDPQVLSEAFNMTE